MEYIGSYGDLMDLSSLCNSQDGSSVLILKEWREEQRKRLSHGGSEKPGNLEVGGASRDSTGLGALEEGLISS